MHVPIREPRIYSFKPSIDSGFTRVDFLSAADKANNDSPFPMAIHKRNEELRLRIGESGAILFSAHEVRGLSQIPRALGLIEDHNMLRRSARIDQCIVAKVMNVLDESFDALTNFSFSYSKTLSLLTRDLVTGKRFTKDSDK